MILLDTSAIYALADDDDPNHRVALETFSKAIAEGEDLLLHSYIVSEAAALLQRRLGLTPAIDFLDQHRLLRTHWITAEDHMEAAALFVERGRRGLSLTDCASFVVMRRYGISHAFAYDADFEAEGFARYQ